MSEVGFTQEATAIVYRMAAELRKGGHHEQAAKLIEEAAAAHKTAVEYGYVVTPKR